MFCKKSLSILLVLCTMISILCLSTTTVYSDSSLLDDEIVGDLFNVKTNGSVKGNGKTDEATAIKAAIDKAVGLGKGSVYFPKGTYYINSNLSTGDKVDLVFAKGAVIKVGSSGTLTCNAGIVADDDQQIFDVQSSGKVTGTPKTVIGSPMWFGAKGDGKTDDTDAIQRTIDLFTHVNFPYTSKGYVTAGFKITRSTMLEGAGREKNVKLIATSATQNLITVKSSHVQMYCFDLDMAKAPSSAAGLYFDTYSAGTEQNRFENFNIYSAGNAVKDHGKNMVITTEFLNFRCYKGRGTAFVCNNMWGFMYLTDIVIDYSQSAITMTFPAITVRNNAGMILTDVEIIGDGRNNSQADGVRTNESQAMWFQHCTVKNIGGVAFKNTGGVNWHMYYYDCHAENTGSYGFQTTDSAGWMQFSGCSVTGGKGMSLVGNGMQLTDVTVSGSSTHGITSSAAFSIYTDIVLNNNKGHGVYSTGKSSSFINVTGSGNSSALTNVSGSGSKVCTY